MIDEIKSCYIYFMNGAKPGKFTKKVKGPASWYVFKKIVLRNL